MGKGYFAILGFLALDFAFLFLLLSGISTGLLVAFELIFIACFLLLSAFLIFSMLSNKKGSHKFAALLFGIGLLNAIYLFFYGISSYQLVFLILTNIIGFIISVQLISYQEDKVHPHKLTPGPVSDEAEVIPDSLAPETVVVEDLKEIHPKFKPGKYVSSKGSNYFHVPKCDWAKKIKHGNHVWFDDIFDAKDEGLIPHNCIKG